LEPFILNGREVGDHDVKYRIVINMALLKEEGVA
jgi:hypothetical protein